MLKKNILDHCPNKPPKSYQHFLYFLKQIARESVCVPWLVMHQNYFLQKF